MHTHIFCCTYQHVGVANITAMIYLIKLKNINDVVNKELSCIVCDGVYSQFYI